MNDNFRVTEVRDAIMNVLVKEKIVTREEVVTILEVVYNLYRDVEEIEEQINLVFKEVMEELDYHKLLEENN
jgi:hypothetical protein